MTRNLPAVFERACPVECRRSVRSAAKRLALIAAAGELATTYDITGWPEDEALRAAGACFRRWLDARGGAGAGEDMRAVEAVRAFIAAHGSSRFERVDGEAPMADQKVIDRARFKRRDGGEWEYLILPTTWRNEVCCGLNPGRAATRWTN